MKKNIFARFPLKKTKTNIPIQVKPVITSEYKETVCKNSYLGKKGYTILKKAITTEDYEFLKTDLFMKPKVFGAAFGQKDNDAFPVYRENANKIYIPRFYGINRYGEPENSELEKGDNIQVAFVKELRDYQDRIVNIYVDYVTPKPNGSGAILEVPCGKGKTVMALKIISILSKKTLILVHKEFLMNQWIERIAEFLPSARVGKIQGQVFDVEGKDIVIGMIQTMYHREFPPDTFSCFGLTIIDEVHHIGSEKFSKTLLKTVTPYILGISATVERKDGLTQILNMFIGDKIYSEDRKDEDIVSVRGVEFITADREFNETDYDYREIPKYSTMMKKLCAFGPRSDFIVKVIADLLEENPNSQIMVLAHNRSLLTYLYESINHRNLGTVGYYVGGMKEVELKKTESKQIVLATYAMAAEALDIKSLSTLVMATPKTDIEQSVGRILRVKHANPIVVDIIDSHELFKNQWKTRKTFYRKCNYKIMFMSSSRYTGMKLDWISDKTWKIEFEPKLKNTEIEHPVAKNSILHRKCFIELPEEVDVV